MASIDSVESTSLYKSPIAPESSNLRIVENRIVINAPHDVVFDFVSTWSNLDKWLPMTSNTKVLKGQENVSATIGDVLYEGIKGHEKDSHGHSLVPKVYTVVARIPGLLWVVAGTEEDDSWYRWNAHFSTFPLEGGKTLFCRVFQQICKDSSEPLGNVIDPAAIQSGLESLKAAIEKDYSLS